MFDLERWNEIFEAIRKNKLRTFLTGISVASGIFILVILLGMGNGMRNGIDSVFGGTSVNEIWVFSRSTTVPYKGLNEGRHIKLDIQDYDMVLEKIKPYVDNYSPIVIKRSALINYKNKNSSYWVTSSSPDFLNVAGCLLSEGRFLHHNDLNESKKVAVIGAQIQKEIFGEEDPIGKQILIDNISFLVVGNYTNKRGNREESRVYIPYPVGSKIFGKIKNLDQFSFSLKPQKSLKAYTSVSKNVFGMIKKILKAKHIVAPKDDNAIRVGSYLEEANRIYSLMDIMRLFFWAVGICTILAGVVGVSNIMFIIIKERTREIGIRKALGAKPWTIIGMILHESIFLTTISGFSGLILSLVVWEVAGPYIDTKFFKNPNVDFNTAVSAVLVLIISGTIAGFLPAYKAAKIKPIEALRNE